jgi:hypothetical protein
MPMVPISPGRKRSSPEWELEEMIRDVIHRGMRADIAERALAWRDRVGIVLGVMRREMPGIVKEAG